MLLIECSEDNSLTILDESDVICDPQSVQVGDVVEFIYKKKSYEGIIKSISDNEEDLEREMKLFKEAAKISKESQKDEDSSQCSKRKRVRPRSYSPSQYESERELKKKCFTVNTSKKNKEREDKSRKNKPNDSDLEISSDDDDDDSLITTQQKKLSFKDDSGEQSFDTNPDKTVEKLLFNKRNILEKKKKDIRSKTLSGTNKDTKKSPKRIVLESPEIKKDTNKEPLQIAKSSPSKTPINFPSADDDYQLYGKDFDQGNMVHLHDGIYCRKNIYQSAISGSTTATGLARKLLSGVFKQEYLLISTITGQTARSQGPERQKENVICLHLKAREAITNYAQAYARSQDNWINATSAQVTSSLRQKLTEIKWKAQNWCRLNCILIIGVLIFIVLTVLLPLLDHVKIELNSHLKGLDDDSVVIGSDGCKISIIESMPIGVVYPNNSVSHVSTYRSWMDLIASARTSIEIVGSHWTISGSEFRHEDGTQEGEDVFEALLEAGRDRGVRLKFLRNVPLKKEKLDHDAKYLTKETNSEVRILNFTKLLGAGMLHTKLWLVDRTHVYIGSADLSWRALTQCRELGLLAKNCSWLANDLSKIFDLYWKLSEDGKVPASWPDSLATKININNPMNFTLDDNKYRAFVASSPPALLPKGRTDDLEAILHCIKKAEKFIYIAVTNYVPLELYTPKKKYWPVIDDALRAAAIERRVNVRVLIAWPVDRTTPSTAYFLKSLAAVTNSYKNVKIEVKRFIIPTNASWARIPRARIYHSKFMVTETASYIGTSNWSGSYFTETAGIGVVFEDVDTNNKESVREQLEKIFLRDWDSAYAYPFNETYLHMDTP